MHIATISSQRQITIPKALLDQLSLSAKDKVKISVDNEQLVLEPVNMNISRFAGCLTRYISPAKRKVPIDKAIEKAIDQVVREVARG
jgi:AbrB family looped-hinge helix DNA binding protein